MRTRLLGPSGLVLALISTACGHRTAPKPHEDAGRTAPGDVAAVELPARPLGLPDLASWQWRKRAGHAAFRIARKAENREDWPAVVTACKDALTADPTHLEAAWLYAVALAKTNQLAAVTEPLALAAAGDFGKWGQASLEQPALQPYLGTPTGAAWQKRVAADGATYSLALAHSVIVLADGDLYAVDPDVPRWYRLTRTYGAVTAAFASPDGRSLVYLARTGKKSAVALAVGTLDPATGHGVKPQRLGLAPPFYIAYSTQKQHGGFWFGSGTSWLVLEDDKLRAVPGKPAAPGAPKLEITIGGGQHARRLPVAQVTADFDDQSLASAIKLSTSNRVVTVPSPGLIDGNTIVWSPDRTHLALVAQLSDRCSAGAPNVAAFVADAANGTVQELERATGGIAIEWRGDHELAIAGDSGVKLVPLGGGTARSLDGATGLVTPRRKAKCTPEAPTTDVPDDDVADPGEAAGGGSATPGPGSGK